MSLPGNNYLKITVLSQAYITSRIESLHISLRFCLAFLLALVFLLSQASHDVVLAAEPATPADLPTQPTVKAEMGRFSDMETAKAFLGRLVESGYTGSIEQQKDSSGQTMYQVIVVLPADSLKDVGSTESLSWSLLGKRGNNIHAAVTLTGIFTDNAFNTKENRKSDFSVILTPEVWLNTPRTDKAVSYESVSPRSAGGHLLTDLSGERLFGYQASLYYRADIPLFTSKSSPYGNTPSHKLAAGLTFIGNKVSLNLSDQFEMSYQEREAGQFIGDANDRYNANRFSAGMAYDTRNRIIISLDYVNFITNNHGQIGQVLDRHDWGLTPALRYKLSSKINLLAEYTYYAVSYDSNSPLDSREHYLLGGLEWRLTEKSFGRLKAGYEVKNFDHGDRYKGLSFEAQAEHRLSAKTQLSLSAYRKTNEARVIKTAFTITTGARLVLSQMITSKITAVGKLSYINDRHRGTSASSLSQTAVNDDIYQAGIEAQYAFNRWFRTRAEYLFTIKNSSNPAFEYRSNSLLVGLTGSF